MLPTPPTLAARRAAIARAQRAANTDPARASDLENARREYTAARLEDQIKNAVDSWPPLTVEQRTRLAQLLGPISTAKAGAS